MSSSCNNNYSNEEMCGQTFSIIILNKCAAIIVTAICICTFFYYFVLACAHFLACVYWIVGVLGIPYLDVVRVLAAVILLGNVQFVPSCLDADTEVKVKVSNEQIDLYYRTCTK